MATVTVRVWDSRREEWFTSECEVNPNWPAGSVSYPPGSGVAGLLERAAEIRAGRAAHARAYVRERLWQRYPRYAATLDTAVREVITNMEVT